MIQSTSSFPFSVLAFRAAQLIILWNWIQCFELCVDTKYLAASGKCFDTDYIFGEKELGNYICTAQWQWGHHYVLEFAMELLISIMEIVEILLICLCACENLSLSPINELVLCAYIKKAYFWSIFFLIFYLLKKTRDR